MNNIEEKRKSEKKKKSKPRFDKKTVKKRVLRLKKLEVREEIQRARLERLQREAEYLSSDKYRIAELAKQQKFEKEKWYKLDNAGLIFPAMYMKGYNPNFTLSVILNEKVNPLILQQAVNDVAPRFAPVTTTLKKGVFWYYLSVPKPVTVQKASSFHNYKSVIDGKTSMSRIFYDDNEISLSVLHTAGDANSTLTFLNSLLNRYFELSGYEIKDRTNRLSYKDKIQPDETEDSYQKFADGIKRPKDDVPKTYQLKGTKLPSDTLHMVKGNCLASKMNEIAKQNGLTVTQLLNAALLYAIQKEREFRVDKSGLPAVVCSAVNLRKFFPSNTLRNFASYISTSGEGATTLQDMFKAVKKQYDEKLNADYFRGRVNFNVKSQRNFFIKIMPLAVKNFILGIGFSIMGKNARTLTLSNLGKVSAPKEFENLVARYEFHLCDPAPAHLSCACATFNDILCIAFTKNIEESIIEREFFRALSGLGIEFAIEANLD